MLNLNDVDALYRLIGERIKSAREGVGLSQAKLAKRLGLSRTSIVNIEAGRQRAPVHVLWHIAESIGTELGLLIPNQSDYRAQTDPVSLDAEMITKIEEAANGDPVTRRDLTAFLGRVTAKNKKSK